MDDNRILTRWQRNHLGDYIGSYTHRPAVGGIGVGLWSEYAEITRSLAGWTVYAAYLHPCDRMEFTTLRAAKSDARWRLLAHLRERRAAMANPQSTVLSA